MTIYGQECVGRTGCKQGMAADQTRQHKTGAGTSRVKNKIKQMHGVNKIISVITILKVTTDLKSTISRRFFPLNYANYDIFIYVICII